MNTNYIVGIDLGTTNSVVAYRKQGQPIQIFQIPQLVKEGYIESKNTLPSFVYIPGENDISSKNLALPWNKKITYCCGELARKQGNKIPARMVSSAKSWLSHKQIDRRAKILPAQKLGDLEQISPVEASKRYLLHIKESWNHHFRKEKAALLEEQQIFLTVPASFDAIARELTVEAASMAGLQVTLLEEPQAAFYAWLHQQGDNWRNHLNVGDIILVVDVGGGTSDFCLVRVDEEEGNISLNRIAVGDHILLGGDNMDLALAHLVSTKLPKAKLDPWQSLSLRYSCCEAKETLLANPSLTKTNVAILGRSSSLIGGTLKAKITREELEQILVGGFFPETDIENLLLQQHKVGLMQQGLPYAADPGITKHIASFLKQHSTAEESIHPTSILFNGGVFKAEVLRKQVISVIKSWTSSKSISVMDSESLDVSVAVGAVYYGNAKMGEGIRIRGGIPRSYYLGMESSMPAIPGMKPPMQGICVVPSGMEEGSENDVPYTELGIVVGEAVEFPLLSSTTRKDDAIGDIIENIDELEKNVSVEATLSTKEGMEKGSLVPIKLHTKITEVGTLGISCKTTNNKHSWNLEFNIRNQDKN